MRKHIYIIKTRERVNKIILLSFADIPVECIIFFLPTDNMSIAGCGKVRDSDFAIARGVKSYTNDNNNNNNNNNITIRFR